MDKNINRIPKTLSTKFGGPCTTLYVNWGAFKKQEEDKVPARAKK